MAFTFSDSYLKLPPITGESSVDIEEENSKTSNGLVRDKHGLVRLPPIVRLDSLRSKSPSVQNLPYAEERKTDESQADIAASGSSLTISHKVDIFRPENSRKFRKKAEREEEEMKLICAQPAAMEISDSERRVSDSEQRFETKKKTGRSRIKQGSRALRRNDLAMLVQPDSLEDQKDKIAAKKLQKLSRSHDLAKSSPELFHRKINLEQEAGASSVEDTTTSTLLSSDFFPESCSRLSKVRLSVHDFDGSSLSRLKNTMKKDDKPKQYRSQKGNLIRQSLSSPNSPVCSESANETESKRKPGRKSLNDITDSVKQFIDRRRPFISPDKKQNLEDGSTGLRVEGKSCSQNGKSSSISSTGVSSAETLHRPLENEKRHSVYDLQQILGLFQREDLKQQASVTCSHSGNSSATNVSQGNDVDSKSSVNASAYDLREFLMLAAAAEVASGKQSTETPKTKLGAGTPLNLLSPNQEGENIKEGPRKGSIYDLKEFLSLASTMSSGSAPTSENPSRSASSSGFISLDCTDGTSDLIPDSAEKTSQGTRRRSTYDLMEFLSLPKSGANSRSESRQSSASSQSDNSVTLNPLPTNRQSEKRSLSVYDLVEFLSMTSEVPPLVRVTSLQGEKTASNSNLLGNDLSQTDGKGRETRSLSVYDLAEFLSISSGVPPLVQVTTSEEEEKERAKTDNNIASMNEEKSERKGIYEKDSLYNLREILNVMRQEQDTTTASTHNLDKEKKTPAPCPSPATGSGGCPNDALLSTTEGKESRDNTNAHRMSARDVRELLGPCASHEGALGSASQQQTQKRFLRKYSNASQSCISIHVTDESNRSLDLDTDDVFLPLPLGDATNSAETQRKRSSVYDLREFLNILNGDDSPLRRRLSSMSSTSSKSAENGSENHPSLIAGSDSAGSSLGAKNDATAHSRPQLPPRQDSGGNMSLYDLGEFLSLLNTDESPLRRRLSSIGDTGTRSESESLKSQFYNLQEILTAFNDYEQKKMSGEITSGLSEAGDVAELSIPVPNLPQRSEGLNQTQYLQSKKQPSAEASKS
ncbi:serine-rich adhesin for platelets-like [Montipora capricornis]|uniref:serine-rich adhesin for platelets-like n=1 Tax=Montipora capricornis TaxID=246305 RepID=UPI0035F14FFF